jgi:hypothetical protein
MIGRRGATAAIAGLAALLLAFAVVSGCQGANRLRGQGNGIAEAEKATRLFVEAYGTFDFREPAAYRERLLGLSTGAVYEAIANSQVDPAVLGQQQTFTTDAVAVQVTAFSADVATASATTEQTRRAVDPTTGQLSERRLRQHVTCRLVRADGHWAVAEFQLTSQEPLQSNSK